jgi:Fe-Mn family superoxide dismutase
MIYALPKLNYKYTDLEPWIDAKTMEIHYTKHHQTYIDKLNELLSKHPDIAGKNLEDLMRDLKNLPLDETEKTALKNFGGGHLNHSFYWSIMSPVKKTDSGLLDRIKKKFGTVDEFKKVFTAAALSRFGSGWAWLVENSSRELEIYSTPNQDSPYLNGHTPLIGLDVWEHAYYLKYQNRRNDYTESWWNVLKLI